MDEYEGFILPSTCKYPSIQVYRIQGKCPVPPCTEMSTKSCIFVHTSTNKYIAVHTSTYHYILVHAKRSIYILEYTVVKIIRWSYVTECISTYKNRLAQIELI